MKGQRVKTKSEHFTTVNIDLVTHKKLQVMAAAKDKTMKQLLSELVGCAWDKEDILESIERSPIAS